MSSPHLILYKTCPTSSMYYDKDLFFEGAPVSLDWNNKIDILRNELSNYYVIDRTTWFLI